VILVDDNSGRASDVIHTSSEFGTNLALDAIPEAVSGARMACLPASVERKGGAA
jgi:hypothetical protein